MDWIRFVVENAESHLFFLLLDKIAGSGTLQIKRMEMIKNWIWVKLNI